MADLRQGLDMVAAFSDLGITHFHLGVFEHSLGADGQVYSSIVRGRQLTRAHYREVRSRLPDILPEAERNQHSVIVRPQQDESMLLVQVDDVNSSQVEALSQFAFLAIHTSGDRYQAWVSIGDAPQDKAGRKLLARRLRRGAGGDDNASGASRLAGTYNFKHRFKPGPVPLVKLILRSQRVVLCASLDDAGLLLPIESIPPGLLSDSAPVPVPWTPKRGWPDYREALRRALKHADGSPDRSKADCLWCKWSFERGYTVEEIAEELPKVSQRARERIAHGGSDYAVEKAIWGARKAAAQRQVSQPAPPPVPIPESLDLSPDLASLADADLGFPVDLFLPAPKTHMSHSPESTPEELKRAVAPLDPAFNTPEAKSKEVTRTYVLPPATVRMLQPWRCHRCYASGELECLSTDDSLYCWERIVTIHAELSPDCGTTRGLAVSNWRQKSEHVAGGI